MDKTILSIYSASYKKDLWEEALGNIVNITKSRSAVLIHRDTESASASASAFLSYGLSRETLDKYNEIFGKTDPIYNLFMDKIGEGEVATTTDADLGSMESFYKSNIYNNFFKKGNMHYMAGSWIYKSSLVSSMIGIQRSEDQPKFYHDSDLANFKALIPHIKMSLNIRKKLIELQSQKITLLAGMNSIPSSIFILDNFGNIVFYNDFADRLVKTNNLFSIRENKIFTTNRGNQKDFYKAISFITNDNTEKSYCLSLMMNDFINVPIVIKKIDSVPGISIPSELNGIATHIMFVHNVEKTIYSNGFKGILKKAYGLTMAETSLVERIKCGDSIKELSDIRGTKMSTIKSQMKSIYAKMGVKKYSEVIMAISGIG